jgi:rubrerythrin
MKYHENLSNQVKEGKIDELDKEAQYNEYYSDLEDFAEKQLAKIYRTDDDSFLTEQLKRKGFVIDNESEVFVEVNDTCPACNMKLKEKDKVCPDCGLNLYPD